MPARGLAKGCSMVPLLMMIAAAVLLALLYARRYRIVRAARSARIQQVRTLAANLGLEFEPGPASPVGAPYDLFPLFHRGEQRRIEWELRGELHAGVGIWVTAGDLAIQFVGGDRGFGMERCVSYLCVELPVEPPAHLDLEQHLKVGAQVTGAEPAQARSPREASITFEIHRRDGWILISSKGRVWSTREVETLIGRLRMWTGSPHPK